MFWEIGTPRFEYGPRHTTAILGISAGTAIALGVSTAATVAGTGISIYSQMQQGAAANGIAGQNAAIIAANAKIQLQSDRMQALGQINDAQLAGEQAGISVETGKIDEANAYLKGLSDTLQTNAGAKNELTAARQYNLDASLSVQNAATLNSYAKQVDAQGSEQIARFRDQSAQMMALGQNKIAKSGLVDSGSPLAIQAHNAAMVELQAQDIAYTANQQSTAANREAYNQRIQAQRSLLSGRIETQNAKTSLRSGDLARMGMKFNVAGAQFEQAAGAYAEQAASFRMALGEGEYGLAGDKYAVAMGQSNLEKVSGAAQQRGADLSAIATGFSGAASIAGSASQFTGTGGKFSSGSTWKTQSGGTFNPNTGAST